MLAMTGWVLRTWLKITVALALIVLGMRLFATPGWFYASVIGAGLAEWWLTGALWRMWTFEAETGLWWWRR